MDVWCSLLDGDHAEQRGYQNLRDQAQEYMVSFAYQTAKAYRRMDIRVNNIY